MPLPDVVACTCNPASLETKLQHFCVIPVIAPHVFPPPHPKQFYQHSCPLPYPLVFQPIRNLFPFFLSSLPFPWQVFLLFGHYFDHLVCLPHTSLATFTPIASFTGFPALWSILLLLPTFIFPPPGKSFQFFSPFFQSIYSACCFNLFLQPIFWPLL